MIRFILLILLLCLPSNGEEDCSTHNWRRAHPEKDDYLIYGITQDCQIFFARSSQLASLSGIKTDPANNYCFPNLIQMQLVDSKTIRLLVKQQGNRICILSIEIPPLAILIGSQAFTYSLLSTMKYAQCSHAAPPLSLEAEMAFADSAYSDVLYFIEPMSTGRNWTTRQFLLNDNGTLTYLDKKQIQNGDNSDDFSLANDFVVSLDAEKNFLYKRNRFRRNFDFECAFDLLFRPTSVVPGSSYSSIRGGPSERSSWLNSLSVDKGVMVFAETDKQSPVAPTRLYAQSTQAGNHHAHCISSLPYRVEIGIVSDRTMAQIAAKPLPKFGIARNEPPRPFRPRPHHGHAPSTAPPPLPPLAPPTRHHPLNQPQLRPDWQTSSRLTQHPTTRVTAATAARTTSSWSRHTTTEEYPLEPPDESEDLSEDEAAMYADTVEEKQVTAPVSISHPHPSSTSKAAAAAAAASTTKLQPRPESTTVAAASITGTPKNDTLQAKTSDPYALMISSLVTLLVLIA